MRGYKRLLYARIYLMTKISRLKDRHRGYVWKWQEKIESLEDALNILDAESRRRRESPAMQNERPKIVCLCGSGRFHDAFKQAEYRETLEGRIVLTIGCNTKDVARCPDLAQHKSMLDELHLRKIDLADEVLVLDVGGYIGESTAKEIAYAESLKKPIRYWSQEEREK